MRRRTHETVNSEQTEEKCLKGNALQVQVRSSWKSWMKWALLVLCVLYVVITFIICLFPSIVQHLVYAQYVLSFVDLSRPSDFFLNHTINMHLTSEEGVTLGVWHTVPEKKWKEAQGKGLDWYEKSLGDGSPVFIYFHGNRNNRAAPHRIAVANITSSLGYHAVVMDYRGFGDSTGEPTDAGLLTDALYLCHWVRARTKGSPLVIWGHSLGTVVATNTALKLQEQGIPVDAVILEGAVTEELRKYYWRFPYLHYYILGLPKESKTAVSNEVSLKTMKTPLLILHAEDDPLAHFQRVQKLYSIARSALNSDEKVKLVSFDKSLGYLHSGLYRDPALPGIIKEFVQSLTT
ncbi:lysophosphatidylserine lipase ABHD12-like isoform X2 [Hoplias malabaricus]|uniref:lysophosphatidylserine lipase ABHD12-like isoform X2 n=1 Tax=Hoplias malabaricus TaxID=27720 RepID=UPI0034621B29